MRDAVIVDAIRTPIGRRGGALASLRADELLAHQLRGLVVRNQLDPTLIEDVISGCVTQIDENGGNIARMAVLAAGLPMEIPATTINRLCGSGLQALNFACQGVMSGAYDVVVAAGTESMTRVPMTSDLGSFNPNLQERYEVVSQGIAAELMATRFGLTREELDAFSLESHRRACLALDGGHFEREILPVPVGEAEVSLDDGPRRNTSLERLASLTPAFREDGLVTAGSSSQISDGAAALLVMSDAKARELELRPRARFVSACAVGVDPTLMLSGPIPATREVLRRAGLALSDISIFEVNEAFAPVVLAWQKELGTDPERVNPNGGAIALGHPLGCTGARLAVSLLSELERREQRYGLVTLCIGFGQGIATIIERLS